MQDDLVFDLGMHKGEDTAFYLKKGFRIVGVEADPAHAEHCRRRFASEIAEGSLRIIEGAIVPKDRLGHGPVKFYRDLKVSVWGTIDPAWRDRNAQLGGDSVEVVVACVDLGKLLAEHGVPHYMKIDLEGADRACLDYLTELDERPKYLSLEDDKLERSRLAQDIDRLSSLGYRQFCAVQQAFIPKREYGGQNRSGQPISHVFEDHASGPFGDDLAGPWMTREEILIEYKWIYEMYRIFGDKSPLSREADLNLLRAQLEAFFKRPLPGWYDTHAAL
jgi:FkbM family methyltransferase